MPNKSSKRPSPLIELRSRARAELPDLLERISPILARFGAHGEREVEWTILDGPGQKRAASLAYDLDVIGHESPRAREVLDQLLALLIDRTDVAIRAVALANLRLGKHDTKKAVQEKQKKAQPTDDLLWKQAVDLLRANPRHSYAELARILVKKHPKDHGDNPEWLRRKLAKMLGRPAV
jgi:hypothetical protein